LAISANAVDLYLEDNVLAAGNYNDGTGSSDITLIIRIEAGGDIVLDEGTPLGYIVPQSDIDGWTEIAFDDSGWKGGISGVGYGDGDDNTETRGAAASIYTRYYFDVPNAASISNIRVLVDYDDGYILWLNGEEIGRSSSMDPVSQVGDVPSWDVSAGGDMGGHGASELPAGTPNESRWSDSAIEDLTVSVNFGGQRPVGSIGSPPAIKPVIAPLYATGNILAGANFNDGPGSSDMTLIMRLMGDGVIYVDEGSPVKYIYDPDNASTGSGWIQPDFDDSGWADGISGVGFSDGDDNTETPSGLMSIWTRYYFDAPNAATVNDLILLSDFDDSYIAWLNGVIIAYDGGAPAGDPPAWNSSEGGVSGGSGASELPAGQPNEARWSDSSIHETAVMFEFMGESPAGVRPENKLPITWGHIKNSR
jgi:hypothetical protein